MCRLFYIKGCTKGRTSRLRDERSTLTKHKMYAIIYATMFGKLHGWSRPSPEKARNHFDAGLEACKPMLFELAGKLLDAYDARQWNLLIGDDTSGRLPARFVRKVLAETGIAVPTRYIAASRSVNASKVPGTYNHYAQAITASNGEPVRGLLITESAGEGLGSLHFTHDVLAPYCESLDSAIVASRGTPDAGLGEVYLGAPAGDETALHAVWTTFEHPLQTRRGEQWSGALTNLDRNADPARGDAALAAETTYRGVARYCYGRMDALAVEFTGAGVVTLPFPAAPAASPMPYHQAA
jgi:hypothetical protein